MAKKNHKDWSKEDLIKHVEKLEKRKKYGLVRDEERTQAMNCEIRNYERRLSFGKRIEW
jgi:hypothetical protein